MSAIAHGWKPTGIKHPPSKAVAEEFHEADKREGKWMNSGRKKLQIGGMAGPMPAPGAAGGMGGMGAMGNMNLNQMLQHLRNRPGGEQAVAGLQQHLGMMMNRGLGGAAMGGNPQGAMIGRGMPIRPDGVQRPVPPGGGILGQLGGSSPIGGFGGMTPAAPMARPPMSGGPMPGMMGTGPSPQAPATTPQGLMPPRMPATQAQPGGLSGGALGGLLPPSMMPPGGTTPPNTITPDPGYMAPRITDPATLARLNTPYTGPIGPMQAMQGGGSVSDSPPEGSSFMDMLRYLVPGEHESAIARWSRERGEGGEPPQGDLQRLLANLRGQSARPPAQMLPNPNPPMVTPVGAGMARGGKPLNIPGMAQPGLPGSMGPPRTVSPLQSLVSSGMAARHRGFPGFGISQAAPSGYAAQRELQRSRIGNFPV
jgi:hypothetical protein